MPQLAIKGIYKDGKIIPMEDIPFHNQMDVIIVFTPQNSVESRYFQDDWQLAEKQVTEDYHIGNIKSANSIDEMFEKMGIDTDDNTMVKQL